jgi:Fe-S cluster assembly protein SufD
MKLADLPSRRAEAWKWTDLRAALAGEEDKLIGPDMPAGAGPIEALARLMLDAYGQSEMVVETSGETFESVQSAGEPGAVARLVVPPGMSAMIVDHVDASGAAGTDLLASFGEIEIGEGASLSRVLVQQGEASAPGGGIVLNELRVRLAEKATFRQFVLAEGARLARIETQVEISGAGAECELGAVYLAGAGRHVDFTSQVRHDAPGATTRQNVKGAAKAKGRGVFQGKFKVERAAQKTDAEMAHNALLLDQGAEVFAKPELEIYADDVKCSHGNTAGQLDEGAIFYLRSRGILEAEARAMITRAFLLQALPEWLEGSLRDQIEGRIDAWLGARHG